MYDTEVGSMLLDTVNEFGLKQQRFLWIETLGKKQEENILTAWQTPVSIRMNALEEIT